jgi:hypothetical protein
MKKLSLAIIAFFLRLASLFAQDTGTADSTYVSRRLRLDEVNLVSSYYRQDGSHSAVTGGTGSEELTDFANTIDLKLHRRDGKDRLHTIGFELGIDNYTSASSDKIDPGTISSASSGDTRIYPSLSWTLGNEAKGYTAGLGASFSTEYDYTSFGFELHGSRSSSDKNRELSVRLQAYFDTWRVILPIELRTPGNDDEGTTPRNSYSASLSYAQVVSRRLQLALLGDLIYQQGLLATRYQRVFFTDGSERVENLPDSRFKIPLGLRASYFLGDRLILRAYYRFYTDDWGLQAHTASLELPVKIGPFLSIAPLYRYYRQTAAEQFAPYASHRASEAFYTSDYDLSALDSHFMGLNVRLAPARGVFGIRHFSMLELRYGHYLRSDGLQSDIITLHARYSTK